MLAGCLDHGAAALAPCLRADLHLALQNNRIDALDVLFVIDDSGAMRSRAASVHRALGSLAAAIVHPSPGEAYGSVQIAVVSADLGTHGTAVAGCTGAGDDGLLNPRTCTSARSALPPFLLFESEADDPPWDAEDLVCATELGKEGCAVQQPLEAAWRALIGHDARARPGNADPNAGFVRPDALLAIVVISPQDDASVRDCRNAEPGADCDDATDVFDPMSARWTGASLGERLTQYVPGSPQDPTWDLGRYIDPRRPARGFSGLKPGRPENVLFMVATGVPDLPLRANGSTDWDALLAPAPDGRPRPRRLIGTARRFAETYANGSVISIERDDLTALTRPFLQRLQWHADGRCLTRRFTARHGAPCCDPAGSPTGCAVAPGCSDPATVTVRCSVTERLSVTTDPTWCSAAHGRHRGPDRDGRVTCRVDQIATSPGTAPPRAAHGFYYDTTIDPANPSCGQRISFTRGDGLRTGSEASIDCVLDVADGC